MACSNALGGVIHRTLFLKFTLSIEAPQLPTDLCWQAQRPNTGDIVELNLKGSRFILVSVNVDTNTVVMFTD